ncbi:transposase [Beggiatoa sp. PS]|nr:transposase [Beggiatoa sp. PS]
MGKAKPPGDVPIQNQKQRQTYYGAINQSTKEFFLKAYPRGNGVHTVSFLKELFLRAKKTKTKMLLIWDGASYHKGFAGKNT